MRSPLLALECLAVKWWTRSLLVMYGLTGKKSEVISADLVSILAIIMNVIPKKYKQCPPNLPYGIRLVGILLNAKKCFAPFGGNVHLKASYLKISSLQCEENNQMTTSPPQPTCLKITANPGRCPRGAVK